ncbi:hypothetical protein UPYG_G00247530 [Umbra pygmaea]|uniref:Uncharacterized protein n=1 Tax=Umbra pygmaea TaxID=75934 RepID=A0ABD0W6X6_UMBPY
MSFLQYCKSFPEIGALLKYLSRTVAPTSETSDKLVGFGKRPDSTWREICETRADGYADFIIRQKCVPGTQMYKLQLYLMKQQSQENVAPPLPIRSTAPNPTATSTSASDLPGMEE